MATMADVATYAGVTKQTVSNVLSGKVVVREKTRKKVLAAVEALGYRPNLIARGLRQGKTYVLAIVVPTITNPFYADVVDEVERIAVENGYNLLLCTTQGSIERTQAQLHALADRLIDGVILFNDRALSEEMVESMSYASFPVIFANWENEPYPKHMHMVGADYREAGYLAGQHFMDLGYRSEIAIIYEAPQHESRFQGFRTALQRENVELASHQIITTANSASEDGYQATQALLSHPSYPKAIYTTNDLMALGCFEALNEHGLRIPEDISVIGSDNIFLGKLTNPSLTTIEIPRRDMAAEMTRLLLRGIAEETLVPRLLTLLRPKLIIRHSTRPATS